MIGGHHYVSGACSHGHHGQCRRQDCALCKAECSCVCHRAGVFAGHPIDGRPPVGAKVMAGAHGMGTVIPTAETVDVDHVTVMLDGSGSVKVLALDLLWPVEFEYEGLLEELGALVREAEKTAIVGCELAAYIERKWPDRAAL